MAFAGVQHVKAAVHQAFGVHALAHTGFVQQIDGDLLQHPGANAAQHIVAALAFQNDGIDACLVQQLAQQEARRPRANDGHLRAGGDGG